MYHIAMAILLDFLFMFSKNHNFLQLQSEFITGADVVKFNEENPEDVILLRNNMTRNFLCKYLLQIYLLLICIEHNDSKKCYRN